MSSVIDALRDAQNKCALTIGGTVLNVDAPLALPRRAKGERAGAPPIRTYTHFFNTYDTDSFTEIFWRENISLHLQSFLRFKVFNEVKKMYTVYIVPCGLFLVLLIHTFEVHGHFYSNGLDKGGYVLTVLIQLNVLE